ncbi:GreA/GreB family elongation factor [Usitatibacter palustris]|uniref:Regulator of nucleoside diphosphate kinase n=1 Tax=Usitatibacter palustris TaxID=2732487 RepID=A0A6M4H9S9_9PROT|nr:GreA/GreB family elongation factor [Usitatibacter palustris]QJR14807.1 Regulator of nucleoside diphosphate kinase [Usitatibacter palustris]
MTDQDIRLITELDAARIRELGHRLPGRGESVGALAGLIDMVEQEAEIVPGAGIDPDVVTVNSTVSFRDEVTRSVHRVTVVYPHEMSVGKRRISVVSPVGRALLGSRAGGLAAVELPDGTHRMIRLLEIHYQPEAAGHFTR